MSLGGQKSQQQILDFTIANLPAYGLTPLDSQRSAGLWLHISRFPDDLDFLLAFQLSLQQLA